MRLSNILRFIMRHPLNCKRPYLAAWRFISWQLRSRISNKSLIHQFTSKSKLIVHRSMQGATGNLYCGLHEFEEMSFVLHFLRAEDLFVDVGANIGSYTVLASAHCGANTVSIEPVPETFSHILANISLNGIEQKVDVMNIAVGAVNGLVKMTADLDSTNRIVTNHDGTRKMIEVPLRTLDDILAGRSPALIKIDVEGYEAAVIDGAQRTLADPALKAIIIELMGTSKKYGFSNAKVHEALMTQGFAPYSYLPFQRKLIPNQGYTQNTIYIRDKDAVKERLASAAPIEINGQRY